MGKLLDFLKPSVQGNDGKASARALTNFWYVAMDTVLMLSIIVLAYIIVTGNHEKETAIFALKLLIWASGLYKVTVLLLYAVISYQQVNETVRALKGSDSSPTPLQVETKTVVTQADGSTTDATATNQGG